MALARPADHMWTAAVLLDRLAAFRTASHVQLPDDLVHIRRRTSATMHLVATLHARPRVAVRTLHAFVLDSAAGEFVLGARADQETTLFVAAEEGVGGVALGEHAEVFLLLVVGGGGV